MARKEKKYRRLPGSLWTRRHRFFDWGRYSQWLGDDHLLHIRATQFTEKYKRFYLEDIQAITISRTPSRRNTNLFLGAIAALSAAGAAILWFYAQSEPGYLPVSGILAGNVAVWLILILGNTLLGPTCVCRLHTAVQIEEFPSLSRIRTARKAVGILRPLIESAQGQFSPVDFAPGLDEDSVLQASTHVLSEPSSKNQQIRHEDGRVHTVLFGWLVVSSLAGATELFYRSAAKSFFDMFIFLGVIAFVVMALRRQDKSDLPDSVKRITWIALGLAIAEFLFSSIYGTIYSMTHIVEVSKTPPVQFSIEGPVFDAYCMVAAISEMLLAVLGLAFVRSHQRKHRVSHEEAIGETVLEKE